MKQTTKTPARAAGSARTRWIGQLEGMHEGLLYGWARDNQAPEARVVVEICLDGAVVGATVADIARPDLGGGWADCCHGFVADIGALAAEGQGALTARVANTEFRLDGGVTLGDAAPPPAVALNFVMGDGGLRLTGWLVHPDDSRRTMRLAAYLGARKLAETTADKLLPHMRGRVDGAHGFMLDLPIDLADGGLHVIHVVDSDGRPLHGSPLQVCLLADGARTLLGDAAPVLHDVIDMYERHVPRSLGFAHYAAWAARFEPGDAAAAAAPSAVSVLVLVSGQGDSAATVRSVKAQRGVRCAAKVIDGAPGAFAAALSGKAAYVCCVRAGDTLPAHAVARALEGFTLPGACIVYTDSETGLPGQPPSPWFKPAWNPEYALGSDHPLELMLVRADWVRKALQRPPADAAEFAWEALGAAWPTGMQAIVHVPRVLYRFNSVLRDDERARRHAAAAAVLARLEPGARLEPMALAGADFSARRLRRPLTAAVHAATVSLIVPTRDGVGLLRRCIDSLLRHTDRPGLEIIVADNDSAQIETLEYFETLRARGVRIVATPGPFNFSRINNAAIDAASGEVIGMINNDIEALHDGWLEEMLSHLLVPGVGAVGAKLLWPNGMVQHGGVLLGMGNVAGHYGNLLSDADAGDHGRNQVAQQVSAVTAACLLMRKADYLALGGLDESAFPVAFNDVDLCLRLRARGDAIVWTPFARLLHAESASRGPEDTPQKRARGRREIEQLRRRWAPALVADPAYHPSLNLDPHTQTYSGLALPPRDRKPRTASLATSI